MKIWMVTPAPLGSLAGNRASANRWATILSKLGHKVTVATAYHGEDVDLMVALHAWRSADSIVRFAHKYPQRPLVVVLTGTDAYRFLQSDRDVTLNSLSLADHIVGLHGQIGNVLPESYRHKLRVIVQSARPLNTRHPPKRIFRVCVAGHLREEKDPLLPALAVRDLPGDSRIRVDAYGGAHTDEWAERARREMQDNPRYVWHGEIPHVELRRVYTRSHLLVLPSIMEGGANVISEAVMSGLPILASNIAGSTGLLGDDYPGYYPVGDLSALKEKLLESEQNPDFYNTLSHAIEHKRPLFTPEKELTGWANLIADIEASRPSGQPH
ncbi:MAG: selenoneine biosynthesis selenosugar synthase SenB [bacterium]